MGGRLIQGSDLSVFYDVGKRGRLRPGGRVMTANTFSSRFRLPDGTSTETGIASKGAPIEPPCSDHVFHGDFVRP